MVYYTIQRRPRLSYELGDSFFRIYISNKELQAHRKDEWIVFYYILVIYTQSVREMLLVRKLDPTISYMQDVNA